MVMQFAVADQASLNVGIARILTARLRPLYAFLAKKVKRPFL